MRSTFQVLHLFLIILLNITGRFSSPVLSQTSVAIPELDATGIDSAFRLQIELFICENLAREQAIHVFTPKDIQIAFKDSTIDLNPLTMRLHLPKIIQQFNTQHVLLGQVAKIGELFTINLELFDSTSQSIFNNKGSYEGNKELFLVNTLEPLVNEIADFMTRPDTTTTGASETKSRKPWYKKWWVWTGVGGAAIITSVILFSGESKTPSIQKTNDLANPPDLPDNP